jgi:two-component system phosphate regulon sensor histidine kinase PhoR
VRVTIIAPNGVVLGDSENDPRRLENHGTRPEVLQALHTGTGRATRHSATEQRDFTYLALPVRDSDRLLGIARVSQPLSTVNAGARAIAIGVAIAASAAALAATVLAVVIAGAITRPLERLRHAARSLAGEAPAGQVVAGGGAEVADLAAAFNEMSARLQETLRRREEERSRLEALLASSADALLALDSSGTIRYLNPAARLWFGDALDRSFFAVARDHELTALVRSVLAAPLAAREARRTSPPIALDGRGVWVQAATSPIEGGGAWALLLILHDVTEVRQAETTRRDFVANVSHELRTPLAGIKAVVETLRDGALHDPAAADAFLASVDAEVDRLVQLVEELLELARIESGTELVMDMVDPRDVLAVGVERFRLQAERAGVGLTLEVPDSLPPIRADAARLGQSVGNLIHNALKFTPPGGRVEVRATQAGDELLIAVADTGSGIDPRELPRIFERFYVVDRSRRQRGTGLGLAIVKHVAIAHGGTVEVESIPGRGSTFTIRLPLAPIPLERHR